MTESVSRYILKHRNIPVAEINLDSVTGSIVSIGTVYEKTHVPVGIPVKNETIDRRAVNEWWRGRTIPASRICERLQIPHVSYTLRMEEEYPYSVCEDFITPDTELISAWYIMRTMKKPNHRSVYRHYLDCCAHLGIPGVRTAVDQMLVLDYLIVNEDRHQNNFGVIRRADSLQYLGAAPIYDSGTSLWFDKPAGMIRAGTKTACKPFKNSHEEQIRLVTDFDWLDFSALKGIDEEFREIVRGSFFIDEARCEAVCRGFNRRVEMLADVVSSQKSAVYVDSIQFDVKEDISYSGGM